MKFFFPTKRGDRKSLSHTEGGYKGFEVVLTQALEVLATLMGGGGECILVNFPFFIPHPSPGN